MSEANVVPIRFCMWSIDFICDIDFDVIFQIHSSEFIKSLNFGSKLKKKKPKIFTFSPEN